MDAELKFPQSLAERFEQDGKDIDNETTPIYISRIADVYMRNPTDRWFKRMIDDFPDENDPKYKYASYNSATTTGKISAFNSVYFLTDLETWFKKWLSQFTKG